MQCIGVKQRETHVSGCQHSEKGRDRCITNVEFESVKSIASEFIAVAYFAHLDDSHIPILT